MQRIIHAQGPATGHAAPGALTADIAAAQDGVVAGIDCLRLNRLARSAGAPLDKGAGIKVLKRIGDFVQQGEPLYRIHAVDLSEFNLAVAMTKLGTGYLIEGRTATQGRARP